VATAQETVKKNWRKKTGGEHCVILSCQH